MRRLVLAAFALVLAGAPVAAHAQMGGGGGEEDSEAAARKRKQDKEWEDKQAPLRQLRNAGPCPFVKALYDAARYVEMEGGREAASSVGYTGEIQGISSGCAYKADEPIRMAMDILFEFGKGPTAKGSAKTYRYWVAVTDRNRTVIARQSFDMPVKFADGKDRVYVTEHIKQVVIPRATATTSGANFEVLVGFEVTPQMAEFNRDGKRFRANAGVSTAAAGDARSRP